MADGKKTIFKLAISVSQAAEEDGEEREQEG